MKAVKNNWLAFAIMAALAGGCGDSAASNDGDNTGGGNDATAGTNNGGTAGGNTGGSGGTNNGGTAGTNTGGTGGTDNGGTAGANTGAGDGDGGGGNGNGLPAASECGALDDGSGNALDTSAMGGCYYFYCYTTEAELAAAASPSGACKNDVALQCKGDPVTVVAGCARQPLISAQIALIDNFKSAVKDCAKKDPALATFSDGCLDCGVESAACAGTKCFQECINGDSPNCDQCRENAGCTPDFYACAGLPDPNKP